MRNHAPPGYRLLIQLVEPRNEDEAREQLRRIYGDKAKNAVIEFKECQGYLGRAFHAFACYVPK